MKRLPKSKFIFIILPAIIILSIVIRYRIIYYKSREITYVVERYMTTGLLNSHKLFDINDFHLSFSDGRLAIMRVNGLQKKSPHKKVQYDVFLEKSPKGIWKVKKLYQVP
ncbi:hypothetical protein [Clostridium lundense]|uniref:hypothetical protein n=1 Tax=Clostridium lundense TaxID=319475 RepID=UPI00054FC1B7|nr:hypothetical protein [Clostridium lundense]